MQIIQELLEFKCYETIFFKSWEYGNEEKPWIPFMIKVVNELFKKEKRDKRELIQNIFLFSTDVVLQTYSQGKVSIGGILDLFRRSRKTSPVKEWSSKDANIVIERVTKIEEFKKAIEKKAKESPKGKIIIFIDDLDRIPEKMVDFLNSLKTFLDIRGCIFVLGCDYEILDSALNQKYKGEFYEDYFDKIVQTEFYIPKISVQAIKNYLQFLTGWNDKEIEECTQLVVHSIGGNPRKIKRVVNAAMLIKSVFERRLATFLEEFERPKVGIKRKKEGKEEEIEEPITWRIKISSIFSPSEVFDLLFDKKVLFKLVCMREQWSDLYQWILSEEKKRSALISLQDADTTTHIQKYLSELLITTPNGPRYKLEEKVSKEKNLSNFVNDFPRFQGSRGPKNISNLVRNIVT